MAERMGDLDRKGYLALASARMRIMLAQLDPLVSALRDMHAAFPTGREGKDEVVVNEDGTEEIVEYQSRTESAALNPDAARSALRRVDKLVLQQSAIATELDDIRSRWLRGMPGGKANEGDPGCEVMAKAGKWEETYRTGTVGGNLDEPARLGRWAYDFVRNNGRLPYRREREARAEGRNVHVVDTPKPAKKNGWQRASA